MLLSSFTPEWISALSAAATAVVAVVAAIIALAQIRQGRSIQREATANSIYSEQLRLDLQYPDLAGANFRKLVGEGRFGQYEAYCSHLFWACQNILETSNDPTWRESILYYLALHAEYIERPTFKFGEGYYSSQMIALFKEAVARKAEILNDPEHQVRHERVASAA
jgi:hypothetical protein